MGLQLVFIVAAFCVIAVHCQGGDRFYRHAGGYGGGFAGAGSSASGNSFSSGSGTGYTGGYAGTGGFPGAGFFTGGVPNFPDVFQSYQDTFNHFRQAAQQFSGGIPGHGVFKAGPGYGFYSYSSFNPFDWKKFIPQNFAPWNFNDISGGGVGASASGFYGPGGGHGTAQVFPPAEEGIDVRFGDSGGHTGPVNSASGSIPPPSGGFQGVFVSSSSGQSVGPDGKATGFKKSSVSFNDNGKVTSYTSHDP